MMWSPFVEFACEGEVGLAPVVGYVEPVSVNAANRGRRRIRGV